MYANFMVETKTACEVLEQKSVPNIRRDYQIADRNNKDYKWLVWNTIILVTENF